MKLTKTVLLVLPIAFLFGCTVPYQPAGINGGYSHQRTANDRFTVTYQAPVAGYGEQRMRDYCLLRSADITKDYKFSHFTIESDMYDTESEPSHISTSSTTKGESQEEDGKVKYEEVTTGSSSISSRYQTTITYEIRCYEDVPQQGNYSEVYDANQTIWEIRSKYGLLDEESAMIGLQ